MPPSRTRRGRNTHRLTPLPRTRQHSQDQLPNRLTVSALSLISSLPPRATSPKPPQPQPRRLSSTLTRTFTALAGTVVVLILPFGASARNLGEEVLRQAQDQRPGMVAIGSRILEGGDINPIPVRDFYELQRTCEAISEMGADFMSGLNGAGLQTVQSLCRWIFEVSEQVMVELQPVEGVMAQPDIHIQGSMPMQGSAEFEIFDIPSAGNWADSWVIRIIYGIAAAGNSILMPLFPLSFSIIIVSLRLDPSLYPPRFTYLANHPTEVGKRG